MIIILSQGRPETEQRPGVPAAARGALGRRAPNPQQPGDRMTTWKAAAALIVVGVALWACDSRRSEVTSVSATKEIHAMEAARSHTIPIPPIDAAAPARTETATFALG
jgi:hypothetical protein